MDEKLYQKVWRAIFSDTSQPEALKDPQVRRSIQHLFRTINTPEPDYNQLWQRIEQRCEIKQKSTFRHWKAVAAVFIPLFLGLGSYLLWSSDEKSSLPSAISLPQGVQLTLADGVKIAIQDTCQTTLLKKQGITLQQDTLRQGLQYTLGLAADSNLEYNTIEVPVATDFRLQLSDGTVVFLNADSRLKYPTAFASKERKVYLEGEAYFEVTPDSSRPFRVEVRDISIEVLGTAFNVQAYPENNSVYTTLATGKVQVKRGEKQVLLHPGEQACSLDSGFIVQTVDVQEYSSWKDGLFIFNKMPLVQIMRQMERWYDLSTVFMDTNIQKYTFTGMINKNLAPEETFRVIEKTVDVHFSVKGKQVVITKRTENSRP